MKMTKSELAASPHLVRLLDPAVAQELGILHKDSPQKLIGNSPADTLKDVWKNLTPEAKRKLRGAEAKEHGIFSAWLLKHSCPHIHAPTSRKVVDLPPGWPDYTLIRNHQSASPVELLFMGECLLLELKVPGGVLSWEQKEWAKLLPVNIVPSAYAAIRAAAIFYHIDLPVLNRTKEMEFPNADVH